MNVYQPKRLTASAGRCTFTAPAPSTSDARSASLASWAAAVPALVGTPSVGRLIVNGSSSLKLSGHDCDVFCASSSASSDESAEPAAFGSSMGAWYFSGRRYKGLRAHTAKRASNRAHADLCQRSESRTMTSLDSDI